MATLTHRRGNLIAEILIWIFLIILFVISIIPFYIMIVSSTWDNATLATSWVYTIGKYFSANYTRMMLQSNIWRGMVNSLVIAISATICSSYFGALTAFGFSKFRFPGQKVLFGVLLGTMMIPGQLGIIGYFTLMHSMGLLDTYVSLIVPYCASAIAVFWNKQYLDSFVPDALLEAARIDGCGDLTIFHRIVFPIIIPAVATQGIFTFVAAWNTYLQPAILLFSQDKFTLPILIKQMQGIYESDYGVIYVGITLSMVPIFIIYLFFSKHILNNVAAGAVKG